MQISRWWRMYPQMLRLQGVRYSNGEVCLQARPHSPGNGTDIQLPQQSQRQERAKARFKVASY